LGFENGKPVARRGRKAESFARNGPAAEKPHLKTVFSEGFFLFEFGLTAYQEGEDED
jgi:hypothetical protein